MTTPLPASVHDAATPASPMARCFFFFFFRFFLGLGSASSRMAGGQCRFRMGGRPGIGLGIATTLFVASSFPSSSSSNSSAPKVGLGCYALVRDSWREIAEAYLGVKGTYNVFFDEDAPEVSTSLVETPITSPSGLVSKVGGVPAGL